MNFKYSTKTEGIKGKIKRRYSDFIVEELAENYKCKVEHFIDEINNSNEEREKKKGIELEWPPFEGDDRQDNQLILEMEKFNMDLNLAIKFISRFLHISNKRIGYAGIKDKRAITSQRISIWNPEYESVKKFRHRGIFLKPVEWSNERIELGDLKGNKFTITIRDIDLNEEEIKKRVNEFEKETENGIANYFGEQRFGGIRQVSHLVGKEFLKDNAREAVMLYLAFSNEREEEEVRKARENLKITGDYSKAVKEFPAKYRYERAILHHLCKHPNDFIGAFRKLPKKLTYLFVHAYQSYLFNKVIEKRMESGIGLKAVQEDVLEEGVPTAPLFGFETELAEGKIGEIEKSVLDEEDIELNDFKVKAFGELSSKGNRRKIILKPEKFSLISIENDEFYEGRKACTISFELEKGSYATTLLEELMKNQK